MRSGKPRSVLHVVPQLSYYGAENFVAALATAQADAGLDVRVLTMYSNDRACDARRFEELPIRRGRRDATFPLRMIDVIRRHAPDVVHTHAHNGKYWGRTAAVLAGVPVVIHTEHNSAFERRPLARLGNLILHPLTYRIVAVSQMQADALAVAERVPKRKIVVIPNGIVASQPPAEAARARMRAELHLEGDERAIFLVGRLEAVKNQQLAVRAFAHLLRALPRARLFFAGEGSDESFLRALCADLDVARRVSFCGFRDDVRDLLAAADALLIASHNEAMPLTALEAMFAGTPIVSTPWKGANEVLGDAAAIAPSWDSADLARTLHDVLADACIADDLAQRGLVRARTRYDIAATQRAYRDLYDGACADRSAANRRMIFRRS